MTRKLWLLETQWSDIDYHMSFEGIFSTLELAKHYAERLTTESPVIWSQVEGGWDGAIKPQRIRGTTISGWSIGEAELDPGGAA